MRSLHRLLDDLEDLRAGRVAIVDAAKRLAKMDDIKSLIVVEAAQLSDGKPIQSSFSVNLSGFESLFEREIGKYSGDRRDLATNAARQEDVLAKIRTTNDAFLQARKSDPQMFRREAALQKLYSAHSKYIEITSNLVEGIGFYTALSTILNKLQNETMQWIHERRIEATSMLDQAGSTSAASLPSLTAALSLSERKAAVQAKHRMEKERKEAESRGS